MFLFLAKNASIEEDVQAEKEKPLYLAVLQLNKYTQTITKCLGLVGLPLTASQSKVRAAVKCGESRRSGL